jgi:hypothetical protein
MIPNGFGAVWRIRTHRHVRTMRSVFTCAGTARAAWPRLQETERVKLETDRLRERRRQHSRRAGR